MSTNLMVSIKAKNYGPANASMQPQAARTTRLCMCFTPDFIDGLDSQKGSAEEREQGTH